MSKRRTSRNASFRGKPTLPAGSGSEAVTSTPTCLFSGGSEQVRLAEVRHRYVNALQLAVSLLVRQARRYPEQALSGQLHAAAARLKAVHHLFFELDATGEEAPQASRAFLQALCDHLVAAYLADAGVRCEVDAVDTRLAIGTCRLLGLAVHEVVVNAVKHAFPGGGGGLVIIRLRAGLPGQWCCSVEDDGVGFEAMPPHGGGMGRMLIAELVGQMGGTAVWERRAGGGSVHLTFTERSSGSHPSAPIEWPPNH